MACSWSCVSAATDTRNPSEPSAGRTNVRPLSRFLPDPDDRDWNRCAQAAVAAMLEPHALGPYAQGANPSPETAISELMTTHPPDMPFRFGSTAFRLARMLRDHGFTVRLLSSSWLGRRREATLAQVARHAAAGWPVPVCLDDGLLGGRAFEAHWALVHDVQPDHVTLSLARSRQLPLEQFLEAWNCRHLPYTHNHCAVLAERW